MFEQQQLLYLLCECVSFFVCLFVAFFFVCLFFSTAGLTFRDKLRQHDSGKRVCGHLEVHRRTVLLCIRSRDTITLLNVTDASWPVRYCQFERYRGRCDSWSTTEKCSCDPDTGVYTVRHPRDWRGQGGVEGGW